MVETRLVRLTNIVYTGRETYLSVCGSIQLENFVKKGTLSCYDSSSAPTELDVTIQADFNDLDSIIDAAQKQAEEDLGLKINSFSILY